MTKRLAILLVCAAVVGLPSFAQFSGQWEASLLILPSPPGIMLETSVLSLAYGVAVGWQLTSTSTFGTLGLTAQAFGVIGQFGPLAMTGGLDFNPQDTSTVTVTYPPGCAPQTESVTLAAPAYKSAWFKTTLTFFGAELALTLNHWAYPYSKDPADPEGIEEFAWPCCPPQTQAYTLVGFVAHAAPATLTSRFADCGNGITFKDVTLTLSEASLCCGITHDLRVYFTRLGFQYLSFTLDLPLCCGISLEASVTYTVAEKTFGLKPKWSGGGQVRFEVYGDVLWDDVMMTIEGLAIYGYRLRCEFSACSYVEFLTALDVSKVEQILDDEDLLHGNEFQYVRLGFCGPGCCGGHYTIGVAVYFQPSGTLFGFTRIGVDVAVPLLANLILTTSFGVTATGDPSSLSVGWIMTF